MAKSSKLPPITRDVCGSYKGATRHRYYQEQNCNPCRLAFNAFMAEYHRLHRLKYPEKNKKWASDKYRRNPAKQRAATNKWRAKNMDKEREYHKNWREANPDKTAAYLATYSKTERGKEKSRNYSRKRRALKRNVAAEGFTEQQVLDIYGTNCHLCGEPIDLDAPRSQAQKLEGWQFGLQFDHVVPLSRGGTHTLDNVKPAHAVCNLRKSNK